MQLSASNLILLKADHLLKAKLICFAKKVKEAGIIAALDLLLTGKNYALKWHKVGIVK